MVVKLRVNLSVNSESFRAGLAQSPHNMSSVKSCLSHLGNVHVLSLNFETEKKSRLPSSWGASDRVLLRTDEAMQSTDWQR